MEEEMEMEVDQPELEAEEQLRAVVSEVFGNGDLLDEILIRLDSPAFLILACKTNKVWNGRGHHPKLLPRFRERLALRPRPLGFYVAFEGSPPRTKFVPMAQSPELADVISRGSFGHFDGRGDPGERSHVLDCRNGRVLLNLHRGDDGPYAVLRPMDEASVMSLLPELVHTMDGNKSVWRFPDECWDGTSVLVMDMSSVHCHPSPTIQLALLQDHVWSTEIYNATGLLAADGLRLDNRLQQRNVYILSSRGYILRLQFSRLNPMTMSFVAIQLPKRVNFAHLFNDEIFDKHILSRGHGSGVYFIQLKGSRLYVWVMSHDSHPDRWLLDANISLPQAFGPLAKLIGEPSEESSDKTQEPDNQVYNDLRMFGAADYADSVFLVDGTYDYHHIFFLNIRTKTVELVYDRLPGDCGVLDIHPFMMV